MRKIILIVLGFLLITGIGFAQGKQAVKPKPVVPELKKTMSGTGLPYKMINDSFAVIPFSGANIESFDVLVQRASDLYIVYTNLSEITPEINDAKFKLLLQRNNDFDFVKIALDSSNNRIYVRADVFRIGITTSFLTRIIKQVANVTNIIDHDLHD